MTRIRNAGHSELNDMIRQDWINSILLSPDAYDALLYVPKKTDEISTNSGYEPSEFEDLDSNQDVLTYELPVPVVVLDCPDETESFRTMNDGETQLGESELPLVLRIAHTSIPIGSIIEWVEELSTGENRRCWWYVHSSTGYGTANVGTLYITIPARNFDMATIVEIENANKL